MRTKVLNVTIKWFGHTRGCGNAFIKCGCDVKTVLTPLPISKWNILADILMKFGVSMESHVKRRFLCFEKKLKKKFLEEKPDIVYVYSGNWWYRFDIIEFFKQTAYTVLKVSDRLSLYPHIIEAAKLFDLVYTFSEEDAVFLRSLGVNSKYVAAGGDMDAFCPLDIKRTTDVSFVGTMTDAYPERYDYLTRLVENNPDIKFEIWGRYTLSFKKFVKWVTNRKLRYSFKNRKIAREKTNLIQNRSKICLNMNRGANGNAWSDRLSNIAASKSFQLTTYNEVVANKFADCLDTFKDYEDLEGKVHFYLQQEALREEMATRMYNNFLSEYQDTGRISAMEIINAANRQKSMRK